MRESDYKRGKVLTGLWASHWDCVAEMSSARKTSEADLVEYGVAIRSAFLASSTPNILLMTPRIKKTHRIIMHLPVDQRETVVAWHFGEDRERFKWFGRTDREPSKIGAIYKKIGRKVNES